MRVKDLKINFRYLGGNIACLSVDSIIGESIHNDINNEEAIIIFNSLVGEKADCQTVKTLLKENKELKKQLEVSNELVAQGTLIEMKLRNEFNRWRKEYQDTYKDVRIEIKEYKTQQKEFIKYLEDEIKLYENDIQTFGKNYNVYFSLINDLKVGKARTKDILQKYKEIIGGNKDE